MINYNISLNKELAQIVEKNIKLGKYANRSEFFREMIRKMFVFGKKENLEPGIYELKKGNNDYEKIEKMSCEKENISSYADFLEKI